MSKVDVIMPQMGESIAEGTLTRWLKGKGDQVERDESLFEISTDKVDADIPSPASGTLAEVLVEEGQTVEVGTVVARISTNGEVAEEVEAEEEPEPAAAEEPREEAEEREAAAVAAAEPESTEPPRGDGGPRVETREERLRTRSTPLVRRIAAEHDVDISQLEGTGISGRVTKKDILEFIQERKERPERAPAAAPTEAPPPGVMHVPIHGETLQIKIPDVPIRENDRVEEMSVMRQRIMEHMLMSRRISAHVSTVFEFDFERVARIRKQLKPRFAEDGVNLTYLPFIIRAVVEGLKEYPVLNASVVGRKIVYHADINVGIAVALDEGKGLIVPVIKNADELSLLGIARRAQDLGERARNRQLNPDDVQGGTFTITNPGVFGSLFGMPIINQPQVAILGVGLIEKRPVVVDDMIAIRHRAYFGISYDHRVVDGAMCDFFMNKVKEVIEEFPEEV